MRTTLVRSLVVALSLSTLAPGAHAQQPILGFADATAERALEARFDASLKADNIREWMKHISARPHEVGSAYGRQNADFIAAQFRSWGYDTKIEEFDVLFPKPKTRVLELVGPEKFTAKLDEPALPEDATSGQKSEQLPTYNCYSIDGDVTADLVYVNYGLPADYDVLAQNGVDVKGKIAIARYGGSWRGIKPKVAAEHGAIGCLIYSDPRDDGYAQGDVYPKGPWRNENGVQRGSVADMPVFPGDPLTPGVGATKDAKRLALKDAPTLTKIPVLPISYGDALPLLRALGGPVAPQQMRGALPITYHLGPGPAKVHLELEFDWGTATARDVIATMPGAERPDEWIIRGNHHDAWVNGANDPVSGLVAMMEEARGISELAKSGWKPKRTIVYCAWDGEEPGLLGSTEWCETHADELKQKAAVYINSDSNGRGFLNMGGSHTLERLMNEVARDVVDPERKISVRERARSVGLVFGDPGDKGELNSRSDLRLDALGSGSDFSPFLQHLGIASLNLGYGGEDGGGSYHSIYDSFDHYTRFVDPTFAYGVALGQTAGRAVLRLANADVLPLEFGTFAETVSGYATEVEKLADRMRDETEERNRMIVAGTYVEASDPTRPYAAPSRQDLVPHLSFAPLQNAVEHLRSAAKAYEKAAAARSAGKRMTLDDARRADAMLMGMERVLTRPEGLPGRPWYAHQVYAPGFYTGYGVKTLPAVREAIEQREWKQADAQIVIVAAAIEAYAARLDAAAK